MTDKKMSTSKETTPTTETLSPREAIHAGLLKPSECDIVIIVLWTRIGTLLPKEYTKPGGGSYLSVVEWQYEDALQVTQRTGRPYIVVYHRTEKVAVRLDDPQIEHWSELYGRVKTFFERFSNGDSPASMMHTVYETPDDFRLNLEAVLKSSVQRIVEASWSASIVSNQKIRAGLSGLKFWPSSPFPGLRPLTVEDAPIFFGRGRETDNLIKQLSRSDVHFLAVVGASGSGKSSLVGAGLQARLMDNAIPGSRDWKALRFTPGEVDDNPFVALVMKLLPLLEPQDRSVRELAEELFVTPSRISSICRLALAHSPDWAKILLFIDQFEELITLVADKYRIPFIDMLTFTATTSHILTVVTLRSDFYHKFIDFPQLSEILQTGSYPLATPNSVALYEMIVRPSEQAGLMLEDGLAERILEDTGTDPGALALMAYALDELYHACETSRYLTHSVYEAIGKVQGVIGQRAENIFNQKLDDEARMILPHVFRELVEVDERGIATRRRAYLSST